MKKEFVLYDEALALRNLGFNEPCFANYYAGDKSLTPYRGYPNDGDEDTHFSTTINMGYSDKWVTSPLYQQAFRWFREKYNMLSQIFLHDREDVKTWKYEITVIEKYEMKGNSIHYNSYEEAELACLRKLIEIVKNEKYI